MAAEDDKNGGAADWIADRVLRGLIGTTLALPYRTRVPMMGRIVRQVIAPLAGYRQRAMTHLAQIWPDMPAAERRIIADQVADNTGRTLIENYSNAQFGQRLRGTQAHGDGLAALAEAKAAGRPVIFVTAHFGNYEAPRHVLHQMGYEIGGIYRNMANPFFNAHYVRTMQGVSGPVFPTGPRGTTGFVRHLRGGGMATILIDTHDGRGQLIDFMGQPAPTSISAAELALRYDALVIPYFGTRLADGLGFDIAIEAPVPHDDPVSMTRGMTERLEARVRRDPGQWFWIHNRWKPERRAAIAP